MKRDARRGRSRLRRGLRRRPYAAMPRRPERRRGRVRRRVARSRAGRGQRRPLQRRIVDEDARRVEAVLPPFLQPRDDARHVAGRTGDDVVVVGNLRHHAVVIDDAALGQHEAVADAAGLQAGQRRIGVEVDQRAGIGAHHLDLAERRAVEDADGLRAPGSPRGRFHLGLGSGAVPGRAQPAAILAEHGAGAAMQVLQRQPLDRD